MRRNLQRRWQLPHITWPLQLLVFFALSVLFLASLQLHSFWDPLWYNLPATRAWAEAGGVYFLKDAVASFHCGAWDYLFVWAHVLLGAPQGRGLIAAQYFCQWMHLTALLVSLFSLELLLRPLCSNRNWRWLAAVSAITAPPLFYTGLLAKNDWGATMWFLIGAVFMTSTDSKQGKAALTGGIFFGLALASKWTIAFTLLPFVLYWIYPRKNLRGIPLLAAGICLGLSPILFRNWIGTGNPFYPLLGSLIPSPLPESWIQSFEGIENRGSFTRLDLLAELLVASPFFGFGAALFYWLRKEKSLAAFFAMICLSFAFLALAGGKNVLLRWWGPGLLFASAYFFLAVAALFRERSDRMRFAKASQVVFLAGLLFLAPFPWKTALARLWQVDGALQIRLHPSGQSMAWLRMNRPGEKIAVLRDTRMYYLNPLPAVRVWDSFAMDEKLAQPTNAVEFLKALDALGFPLLLDNSERIDLFQNDKMVSAVEELIAKYPSSILFQEPTARVVDIPALLREAR